MVKRRDVLNSEAEINPIKVFGRALDTLKRPAKRLILIFIDLFILSAALYLALLLRLGTLASGYLWSLSPAFVIASVGGVGLLWTFGFYKILIRAFDFISVNRLASACFTTGLLLAAFAYLYTDLFLPRSIPFLFTLLAFLMIGGSRVFARWLYMYSLGIKTERMPVVIYGAGEAGNKIASILSGSTEFSLVGFIDDDPTIRGNYMRGRKVFLPEDIDKIVNRYGEIKVFLSILSLTPDRKRQIYQSLSRPEVQIEVMPSLEDIVAGRSSIEGAREVQIEDLLGREIVPPIDSIFSDAIRNSTILITGGGGSIGSELCRQILSNGPAHLAILEQSEFALYSVEQSLRPILRELDSKCRITCHLGSVDDRVLVRRLLAEVKPNCIFHAAAYKHVPIVEENILEGIRNNILGTEVMASESAAAGVQRFTLISTDKAVRPTNVMGATKRAAELVVQAQAAVSGKTIFSMVRFGNVLGSSGSVIPLFRSQIAAGGPVTVTHKDVTRYFMTIPEAAQLVVQAAFLARGGEVFVLDMGDPVKINDLARLTIQLSGYSIRDEKTPHGDIAIEYVGLRPGEKLYEELLIEDNASGTIHPKILKAMEEMIKKPEMDKHVKTFARAVETGDSTAAVSLLKKIVSGFGDGNAKSKS